VNRLFIELYMDEDVDVLVADLVRGRGFHATTTQQAGRTHQEDAEQLAYAVTLGAAMFTHNRADYEALAAEYFASGRAHFGIIIAVHRPPYELARRLLAILDQTTADEMENQLRYI
jgi:predicted nuclease of predicted toxin-antitoxin system